MIRRDFLTWSGVCGLMGSSLARADDFGDLLGKAATRGLRGVEKGVRRQAEGAGGQGKGERSRPFTVKTPDGWNLVAHRFRPAGQAPAGMPVILCHGLTYNASFWDLDPACSLAAYLAGRGFDVWAVDLRGCGLSQKWVWKLDDAPEMIAGRLIGRLHPGSLPQSGFATIDPKFANWTLDQHIAQDVPTLVRLVRKHTGAPEVAWVGHSMGGIVAIGHLARFPNPGIGRLATIGSQVTMPNGQIIKQFCQEMIATRTSQLAGQLTRDQLMTSTKTSVHNMFFNERNVDPKVYEALSGPATDIPAVGLMRQYAALGSHGVLLDAAGRYDYSQAVGNIKVPMLITCGAQDQFAPPGVQKFLYDHVSSADKSALIFGRARGFSVDAGHDDALVGLNSREQVYPVLERWLRGGRV